MLCPVGAAAPTITVKSGFHAKDNCLFIDSILESIMPSVGEIIAAALDTRSDVWMKYRNNQGKESARRVTPLEWKGSDRFLAVCLETQKQLTFSVRNILECSLVSDSRLEQPLRVESTNSLLPHFANFLRSRNARPNLVPISGDQCDGDFQRGQRWQTVEPPREILSCLLGS